jgi:hypothetical protein
MAPGLTEFLSEYKPWLLACSVVGLITMASCDLRRVCVPRFF